MNAFCFSRLERQFQPNNSTKELLQTYCNYTVQENDENTVKKSKPPVKVSKSSKIPKPNNQKPNGLNVSYQNDDSIPDISDLVADLILPRPNRNPVKHRKLVESSIETSPDESKVKKSKQTVKGSKSSKIVETSPQSKRATRSTKSKLKNKVDAETIIPTKRSRK